MTTVHQAGAVRHILLALVLALIACAVILCLLPMEQRLRLQNALHFIPSVDTNQLGLASRQQLHSLDTRIDDSLSQSPLQARPVADAYAELGTLYHLLGYPRAANACYGKVELFDAEHHFSRFAEGPLLFPVPYPDVNKLEQAVREQLESLRAKLVEAIARPGITALELGKMFGDLGIHYHRYTHREAASVCYLNAEILDEHDHFWPYGRALLLAMDGKLDDAIASHERCLVRKPDFVPALITLAELELEQSKDRRDLRRAEDFCKRALQFDRGAVRAEFVWGRVKIELEQYAEARTHLETALRGFPAASEIYYPLGITYRELGETAKAESFMARAGHVAIPLRDPFMDLLHSNYVGWRVWNQQGSNRFTAGAYREALELQREAVAQAPPNERHEPLANQAAAEVRVATELLEKNQIEQAKALFREARAHLEEVLRDDPDDQQAQFNLGTILATRFGDDEAAVVHFRESIRLFPDQRNAHINLTLALMRLGRAEEALTCMANVLRMFPADRDGRIQYAWTLIRLRRFDEALAFVEESSKILTAEDSFPLMKARLLATCAGDPATAARAAIDLLDSMAGPRLAAGKKISYEFREIRALALARQGKFSEAAQLLSGLRPMLVEQNQKQKIKDADIYLEKFAKQEPVTQPWPDDHPNIAPPRHVNLFADADRDAEGVK